LTPVNNYPNIAVMKRKALPGDTWEGPWQDPDQPLDCFDVAMWFAKNPALCVTDLRAQKVLRGYEHSHRPWYDQSRSAEMVKRQDVPWWQDLRQEVYRRVGDQLAALFSDYLAGYVLVRKHDGGLRSGIPLLKHVRDERGRLRFKATSRGPGKVTPEWRRTKRKLKDVPIGPGPSLRLPTGGRLRTKLIALMEDALLKTGSGWKRQFIGDDICSLWELIAETIVKPGDGGLANRTIARISRRSRSRK
jgi:hypothetical protein